VSHRNYRHNGFVRVIVFVADRVEVWNPGELPPGLTPVLRKPHGPIPRNPLIAEPLFRVKYVEKAGTGTTDMIADCRKAGLPEPDFEQRGPHFVVTLWRDWLTEDVLAGYILNGRQKLVIKHAKVAGRINNAQYRDLTGISARTALWELRQLTDLGIFTKVGGTGQSTHYILARKQDINWTNRT
jgi:ATP-dependent DNA helicase RecG